MKEERPWGWYEVIDQGDRFKVKNIEVKPGHRLSCLLYTSPSPRDRTRSRMPSSA